MKESSRVSDFVQVLNDGVDFYRRAKGKVKDKNLQLTFEKMAATREQLLNRLQPYVTRVEGEPEKGHTFSGKVREIYTNVLSSIKSDKDQAFIDNLEEIEDKTLKEAREVINEAHSTEVVSALNEFYPKLQKCHAEMSQLKKHHA